MCKGYNTHSLRFMFCQQVHKYMTMQNLNMKQPMRINTVLNSNIIENKLNGKIENGVGECVKETKTRPKSRH